MPAGLGEQKLHKLLNYFKDYRFHGLSKFHFKYMFSFLEFVHIKYIAVHIRALEFVETVKLLFASL